MSNGQAELKFLTYHHYKDLADRLDYGDPGQSDYRDLATSYNFEQADMEHFSTAEKRGQRPTGQLLRYLNIRYPKLTMLDLREKCRIIGRTDVVAYMNKEILGLCEEDDYYIYIDR